MSGSLQSSDPADVAGAAAKNPMGRWTRPEFAWEFLRRNADYGSAFEENSWRAGEREEEQVAAAWGLRFMADPQLAAGSANVFWRSDVAPAVVIALEAIPADFGVKLTLPSNRTAVRRGPDGTHIRLQGGWQALLRGAEVTAPVAASLPMNAEFPARLRALQAFQRALSASEALDDGLGEQTRRRLERAILAVDLAAAGLSYREIALAVFGAGVVAREPWKGSSIRDTTIRLVRTGRQLIEGRYRNLLGGRRSIC